MRASGDLILRIHSPVQGGVFPCAVVPARISIGGDAKETSFEGLVAHRFSVGESPVRGDSGDLGFARRINSDRVLKRSAQRVIASKFQVDAIRNHNVPTEPQYFLRQPPL